MKIKKPNILIIGAGGIGSYLIKEVDNLLKQNQVNSEVILSDFDIVELKNIKYQNFNVSDIGKKKVDVLSDRYLLASVEKIEKESQLEPYELFIICVDNAQTRKLITDYCYKKEKYFIDLRSEGRAVAIFTSEISKEDYNKTIDLEDKESRSCQLAFELEDNIIQEGNKIVAMIGCQLLLNYLREELNQKEYRYYF